MTEPQTEFYQSDAKATAMVAGFGAGKTRGATARILDTKFEFPSINQLYLAPTYTLIKDIFYPELEEMLAFAGYRSGRDYRINKQENDIIFPGYGKILCRTMDKPERLVGFQVGDAFLDEFDTLTSDRAKLVWRKILARARKKYPKGKNKTNQLWISTTPEGFKETYRLFEKERKPGYRLIKAPTRSNPHLPDDYIQTLVDTYPDELIDAYLEGEFVNLTAGTVYWAFDRRLSHKTETIGRREPLHIGMDFNVYHMAATVHVKRDYGACAVNELTEIRDTPDMIEAIKETYDKQTIFVYPDATGKSASSKSADSSDHKLLKAAGFRVRTREANPLIRDRVNSVNTGYAKQYIYVDTDKCPELTDALEQQTYDRNGQPDKSEGLDHILDSHGYFVDHNYSIRKPKLDYKHAS